MTRTAAATLHTDGGYTAAPANLRKLVAEGWKLKKEIEQRDLRLKAINKDLQEALAPGSAIELPGEVRLTIAARRLVEVADVTALRAILGKRFDDLVTESIKHKPEAKLLEIAADADDPLSAGVRDALHLTTTTTVTYRAVK